MTSTPAPADPFEGPSDWRDSPWAANVWLLFLSFPLLSLLANDESTGIKVLVTALMAVFAAVHVLGYRANGLRAHSARDDLDNLPLVDPLNPWPYFLGLIAIQVVCVLLAGLGLLGLMPFIVVYAVFNFSWRIAGVVGALSLILVFALPAMAERLDDFWFFPILIISAGAGASFARMGAEGAGRILTRCDCRNRLLVRKTQATASCGRVDAQSALTATDMQFRPAEAPPKSFASPIKSAAAGTTGHNFASEHGHRLDQRDLPVAARRSAAEITASPMRELSRMRPCRSVPSPFWPGCCQGGRPRLHRRRQQH